MRRGTVVLEIAWTQRSTDSKKKAMGRLSEQVRASGEVEICS